MAVNQYLAFAAGGSANTLTPVAYAALAARTNGFASGVAPSQQCNTPWRQTSVGIAALAQFVVDTAGVNMNDDGSVANFEAGLISAWNTLVAAAISGGAIPVRDAKNALTITSGVIDINCNLGNFFRVLMNANITGLTFSNMPAAGKMQFITLYCVADGNSRTVSFLTQAASGLAPKINFLGPSGAGSAPTFTFTTGFKNVIEFVVGDGITNAVDATFSGTAGI